MQQLVASGCRAGWIIILGLLLGAESQAQIVNTLTGFATEEIGWSGEAEARASLSGGNTEELALSGNLRLQRQGNRHRLRLLGAARRKSSQGTRVAEQSMLHLRHNYRLQPWLGSLIFAQSQQNPFQRLKRRLLLGFGGRFDLLARPSANLALGLAHMVEWEKIEEMTTYDTDQRLSVFVKLETHLNEAVNLNGVVFVQPLWTAPADLRAVGMAAMRTRVAGPLALVVAAEFQYDARPPSDVEPWDWDLETGLVYSF